MTREGEHRVVGDKPVNRRLARAASAAPPPVAPAVRERLRAAQARGALGAPLAEQLRAPLRPGGTTGRVPVAGGVTATLGGVLLFLGWLQAAPLLAGAGAIAALGGGVLAWRGRPRPAPDLGPIETAWLSPEQVTALDTALDTVARELPPPLLSPLLALKALIVRIARHANATGVDEHFTTEDRMYVVECVRRYLPDSLTAYLAVPAAKREDPLEEGGTPQSLLLAQLALLTRELEAREAKLARSASEGLLRQQRFLDAKSRK